MIGRLKGIVEKLYEDKIILDVNGVGYVVNCTSSTVANLNSSIGSQAIFEIETHVREDQITLFGFTNEQEKEWFLILNKVNGVGPKMALGILSSLEPSQLSIIIASKDIAAFKPVSGVGPKLAERIVTELKNKVGSIETSFDSGNITSIKNSTSSPNNSDNNAISDATLALEKLGFGRSESFGIINKLASDNENVSAEFLIKESLKQLSSSG